MFWVLSLVIAGNIVRARADEDGRENALAGFSTTAQYATLAVISVCVVATRVGRLGLTCLGAEIAGVEIAGVARGALPRARDQHNGGHRSAEEQRDREGDPGSG